MTEFEKYMQDIHLGTWVDELSTFRFCNGWRVNFFSPHIFWDWIEKDNGTSLWDSNEICIFFLFWDSRETGDFASFSSTIFTSLPKRLDDAPRRSTSTCAQGTESMRQTFMQGTQACV